VQLFYFHFCNFKYCVYKISIHLCVHTLLCARSFHPVQQLLNTHSFSIAMYCHQQRLRVKVCFPRTWNIKCRCYTNILEKQLSISTHKKIFRLNLFPSNKLNFLNFTKMAKEFYVQQNSFHVTSKYLEILTIWHFKRVVPRLCSPYQGGGNTFVNRQFSETCPTRPPSVYVHQLSWYLLTPCHLLHPLPAMKNPDNTEEDPDTRNQQRKEISWWNIPPISCTAWIQQQ